MSKKLLVIGMRRLYKDMPFQLTEAFESFLIDMKRFSQDVAFQLTEASRSKMYLDHFHVNEMMKGFDISAFTIGLVAKVNQLTLHACAKKMIKMTKD